MEWLPTLSLALGSAWTSGINLYATVTVLGLLQKFGATKLPGGLDVLDNWWIIGAAGFLYAIEFFADKIPYVDSVWDVVHTFIRVPAGAIVAYAATNEMDASVGVIATLFGGGLALSSHGTKAAVRMGANLSPEPVSNWALSFIEDGIAIVGAVLAVLQPILIAIVLIIFLVFFVWFFPKVVRAVRRMTNAIRGLFVGEGFKDVARKAS
jgi:CBS domain containing-hemolysin-like protein